MQEIKINIRTVQQCLVVFNPGLSGVLSQADPAAPETVQRSAGNRLKAAEFAPEAPWPA